MRNAFFFTLPLVVLAIAGGHSNAAAQDGTRQRLPVRYVTAREDGDEVRDEKKSAANRVNVIVDSPAEEKENAAGEIVEQIPVRMYGESSEEVKTTHGMWGGGRTSAHFRSPFIAARIRAHSASFPWPQEVRHKPELEKLIECESSWRNICQPDIDGILSCGILQFHQDGTWGDMSRECGINGSFMNPPDAVRMADCMLDRGYAYKWPRCSKKLDLAADIPPHSPARRHLIPATLHRSLPLGATEIVPAEETSAPVLQRKDPHENPDVVRIIVKDANDSE